MDKIAAVNAETSPVQIVWFRNWKTLKSVGAVEHFHVMIFDSDPDIVTEVTNADKPVCESF